ncbi:failed axon connections homolog [Ruditapes philippinarum]|uniref:failed axon connections homolog n=1 Tax=Ruditapes philippinarum TaxID=129788 RepID=UPI00295BAD96|nr:failed axon connections homolog [Ruditapes philippinarum]
MGHFVMKLETYLRIHKIPFQLDFNYKGGPKNKTPWIEYNGITMGDSQLIIEYFNKEFNFDMNSHLSKQERAVAWAIQKWLEEYTYWLNVYSRWVIFGDEMLRKFLKVPGPVAALLKITMRPGIIKTSYTVGIGRHSDEEVHQLMRNDLKKKFSDLLGDKKYIMGDKITETDCAAFGILSQIRWCTPESCPGRQLLTSDELKNVAHYLDRIKDTYWMDWEEILAAVKK